MSEFLKNNKKNNSQDLKDISIYAIRDYDISLDGVCKYIELNLFDN